jgi:serine/threonine protein phosphatase PrpC
MRIREQVELANMSDIGCMRENNEDYFLYGEPDDDNDFAQRGRLIVIADGMGGYASGEVASRLAAHTLSEVFLKEPPNEPREVLLRGFQLAQTSILEQANSRPELRGMGTTCSAAILRKDRMYLGHIGDSRVCLIRDGNVQQLTQDHNFAAELLRDGYITGEEVATHERRNTLTAALGCDGNVGNADFAPEPVQLYKDDIVMLSTDGLHNMVTPDDIVFATEEGNSLSTACQQLVMLARVRGGPDNITLQLLRIRQVEDD